MKLFFQILQKGCEDLKEGNLYALVKKMFATHEGLNKLHEVNCNELYLLIEYVKNDAAVIGARMMGGGFGGCTINLLKENEIERLVGTLQTAYENATNISLSYYVASVENATEMI